ncbi:MAG: hypothetical protein A3G93_08925 [Nitrospinae bacterium RIFCSPLOWO2_12_FULL_45_22]|nr:MAG: hypothetical protein A3G93_08925 [Nitrospinae bacterium RIFCSPLOWO2_12_FULL_45_22]
MVRYPQIASPIAFALVIFCFPAVYAASPEMECYGHLTDAQLTATVLTLENEQVRENLRAMGSRIEAGCKSVPMPCTYRVIVDPTINALSAPPCYIYITTGLLDFVENKDELAGIIAHELIHIRENHAEKSFFRTKVARGGDIAVITGAAQAAGIMAEKAVPFLGLTPAGIILKEVGGWIAGQAAAGLAAEAATPLGRAVAVYIYKSYSHNQEFAADAMGARCAAAMGYNKKALIGFFERLETLPKNSLEFNVPSHFLKDSPSLAERRRKLETLR